MSFSQVIGFIFMTAGVFVYAYGNAVQQVVAAQQEEQKGRAASFMAKVVCPFDAKRVTEKYIDFKLEKVISRSNTRYNVLYIMYYIDYKV